MRLSRSWRQRTATPGEKRGTRGAATGGLAADGAPAAGCEPAAARWPRPPQGENIGDVRQRPPRGRAWRAACDARRSVGVEAGPADACRQPAGSSLRSHKGLRRCSILGWDRWTTTSRARARSPTRKHAPGTRALAWRKGCDLAGSQPRVYPAPLSALPSATGRRPAAPDRDHSPLPWAASAAFQIRALRGRARSHVARPQPSGVGPALPTASLQPPPLCREPQALPHAGYCLRGSPGHTPPVMA